MKRKDLKKQTIIKTALIIGIIVLLNVLGMRFFTIVDDETLIKKYIETVIRRTFGTNDAMKLAKPILKQ